MLKYLLSSVGSRDTRLLRSQQGCRTQLLLLLSSLLIIKLAWKTSSCRGISVVWSTSHGSLIILVLLLLLFQKLATLSKLLDCRVSWLSLLLMTELLQEHLLLVFLLLLEVFSELLGLLVWCMACRSTFRLLADHALELTAKELLLLGLVDTAATYL